MSVSAFVRCISIVVVLLSFSSLPYVTSQAVSVSVSSWNSIGTQITATYSGSGLSNNDYTCLSPSSTDSTICQATTNNVYPNSNTAITTFTLSINTAKTNQIFYVWYDYQGTWTMLGQTPPNPRHAPTSVNMGVWNNVGSMISVTFTGGVGVSNNDYTCISPSSTDSTICQATAANTFPDAFTASTTFTMSPQVGYTGQIFYVWYGFSNGAAGTTWTMIGQTPPSPRRAPTSASISAWSSLGTVISAQFSGGIGVSSADYVSLTLSGTNYGTYGYTVNAQSSDGLSSTATFTLNGNDVNVGQIWYIWYGFINGTYGSQSVMLGATPPNPGNTTPSPTTPSPTSSPTLSPTSSAIGDPHLTGFDGIEFDFYGSHDTIYCLYASHDNNLNINVLIHDAQQPHRYPHIQHPSFMTRVSIHVAHHYIEFGVNHKDNMINGEKMDYFHLPGYNTFYLTHINHTDMNVVRSQPNPSQQQLHAIKQSIATIQLITSISIEIRIYNNYTKTLNNNDYDYIIRIERQRDDYYQSYLDVYITTNDEHAYGVLGQTLSNRLISSSPSTSASSVGMGTGINTNINDQIDWFNISNQHPHKYQVHHLYDKLETNV